MPDISISEEALGALRPLLDKYHVTSYSTVILHLTGKKKIPLKADPTKAKIVVADPLFGPEPSHSHSMWGADCPVCRQYFWEDIDTMPLPVEERPTQCDYCDQKIKLIYPWEIGETFFPERKASEPRPD